MKQKQADRELKALEDGIRNAKFGLENKTPDGRPLYDEKGDVVATKFTKEQTKAINPASLMGMGMGMGMGRRRRF